MSILVTCECGQQFETRDENAGRRAKCPECGRELVVPKGGLFLPPDELTTFDPSSRRTSGKAIASLVLGIFSLGCTVFTGIPAVILGCLGLNDINRSKGRVRGSGMAIAGIVLGGLGSTFVMFALLLPAVQAAREAARRAQCVNNLKQIGLAMHNYHDANGCFPPVASVDENGRPLLSWRVALLPYLEQSPLYTRFHLNEPWDSPNNLPLVSQMPAVYGCASQVGRMATGQTTYEVVVGPNTLFPPGGATTGIRDTIDGTSNTIMVGEAARPVTWAAPDDLTYNKTATLFGFGSPHPGGFNVLFADGSIRFLKNSIAAATLDALLTRNGGEPVSPGSY